MTGSRSADVARANELVTQVLAASPRNPLIHVVRGTVLRAQNRFEEATTEYETALAIDSNLVSALHGLALCKLLTGSIDGVIPLKNELSVLAPALPTLAGCTSRLELFIFCNRAPMRQSLSMKKTAAPCLGCGASTAASLPHTPSTATPNAPLLNSPKRVS